MTAYLWALSLRIVPETLTLDAGGQARFCALVDKALASRPLAMRAQLQVFLGVLRWLPALRYGAPLERLAPDQQDAALRWFQSNPVGLLRKGFWGVKTLVLMGYYGRPEAGPAIGYTPSLRGNERLRP